MALGNCVTLATAVTPVAFTLATAVAFAAVALTVVVLAVAVALAANTPWGPASINASTATSSDRPRVLSSRMAGVRAGG